MKKWLKDFFDNSIGYVLGVIFGLGIFYIVDTYFSYEYYYLENLIFHGIDQKNITIEDKNDYYRRYDFKYVQTAKTFSPKNHQDIRNIYYEFLNSGKKEFTFYCPKEYKNCMKETNDIIYGKKNKEIENIYVYGHPFNDYKTIQLIKFAPAGEVTIRIKKKYTEKQIKEINKKVDELFQELYDKNDTDYNNIKRIHDYLVENAEYDTQKSDFSKKKTDKDSPYQSDIAYGPLIEGKGICSGYTDAMLLFLEKMHIKNYRVLTETHIWNAVELDGKWYHLDLTWDEGKYTNGKTFVKDKYFLITTEQLLSYDKEIHNFNQEVFLELKQ